MPRPVRLTPALLALLAVLAALLAGCGDESPPPPPVRVAVDAGGPRVASVDHARRGDAVLWGTSGLRNRSRHAIRVTRVRVVERFGPAQVLDIRAFRPGRREFLVGSERRDRPAPFRFARLPEAAGLRIAPGERVVFVVRVRAGRATTTLAGVRVGIRTRRGGRGATILRSGLLLCPRRCPADAGSVLLERARRLAVR
jgi:hypothetical protein